MPLPRPWFWSTLFRCESSQQKEKSSIGKFISTYMKISAVAHVGFAWYYFHDYRIGFEPWNPTWWPFFIGSIYIVGPFSITWPVSVPYFLGAEICRRVLKDDL